MKILLLVAAATLVAGCGTTVVPSDHRNESVSSQAACTLSPKLVPSCGVLWGAAVNPDWAEGETWDSAFQQFVRTSGRRLDVAHYYEAGDELFPSQSQLIRAKQPYGAPIFFFNWKVAPSLSWRAIADGEADSVLDAEAANLRATLSQPFFLSVQHEPEDEISEDPASGMTVDDYNAMFRHVVERLREDGVTNLVSVLSLRGSAFWAAKPWFDQLWPGDDVVDWVAIDPYVFMHPGWDDRTFRGMLNRTHDGPSGWPGIYTWLHASHPRIPIMLGEWGISQEFDDKGVVSRIDSVRETLPELPNLKALVYWDAPHDPTVQRTRITRPAPVAAFRRLASSKQVLGNGLTR